MKPLNVVFEVRVAMFDIFTDFISILRAAGIPVSVVEEIELAKALTVIDITSKYELKYTLLATLVKSSAHIIIFEDIFEKYFTPWQKVPDGTDLTSDCFGVKDNLSPWAKVALLGNDNINLTETSYGIYTPHDRFGLSSEDIFNIRQLLLESVLAGDHQKMSALARAVAGRITGSSPDKLPAVSYYTALAARLLGLSDIKQLLMEKLSGDQPSHQFTDANGILAKNEALKMRLMEFNELSKLGNVGYKLIESEIDAQIEIMKFLLESEINQAITMLKDKPAFDTAAIRTVGQFEFLRADDLELRRMRKELNPLAKILASRLRKFSQSGKYTNINFPATFRKSLSTQGVPFEVIRKKTTSAKPEIIVIADVSGSVASFARFSLHLISAIAEEFHKVNSFVFIDRVIDVTKEMKKRQLKDSRVIEDVIAKAEEISIKGHSDYGYAFEEFIANYQKKAISKRSTVILLGDARTNYHPPRPELLAAIKKKAKVLYFLNPEPFAYWNTGDSVVDIYRAVCDDVVECRTLNQLADFIDGLSGHKRALGAISL